MATECPHCGCEIEGQPKAKGRSGPQLRRFFALVRGYYDHWPEAHSFQPKSPDHLRYWLEVQAGHCEVKRTIRVNDGAEPEYVHAILQVVMRDSEDEMQFVEIDGALITVKRAISISYAATAHLVACRLFDDVAAVAESETGMTPSSVLKAMEDVA